jgi:hypothetical protein
MSILRTLQLWRDVEMFQVFDLDEVLTVEDDSWHISLNAPLFPEVPWIAPELWGLHPDYNYSFDLFLGIFEKAAAKSIVRELYERDDFLEDFGDSRESEGTTCVLRLGISGGGEVLVDDCRISTLPWSLTALKRGSDLSLDAFDAYGRDLLMRISSCRVTEEDVTPEGIAPLKWGELLTINKETLRDLEIPWRNFSDRVVIVAHRLGRKKPKSEVEIGSTEVSATSSEERSESRIETVETDINEGRRPIANPPTRIRRKCDILNSFFLRDLQRVAQRSADMPKQSPLARYVSATPHSNRVDVARPSSRLWDGVGARTLPLGRWPHEEAHFNSLMQQLAINEFMSGKHSLFAVNGPPGTGKTTLVKDIVATTVINRALKLVRYRSPDDAFERKTVSCEVERARFVIRKLKRDLVGFEIVVASSNNNAVENITRELPKRSGLGQTFRNASYLIEVSRLYDEIRRGRGRVGAASSDAALWGLISAPLGNRRNREYFCDALLYGPTEEKDEKVKRQSLSEKLTLHEWRRRIPPQGTMSYAKARLSFLDAHKKVEEELEKLIERGSAAFQEAHDPKEDYRPPSDENFDSLSVQSRSPWLSENLLVAQSNLFLSALELHQAWTREALGLGTNLAALGKLLSRPDAFDEQIATYIWQTLFMVVPVVSTTLASVERMCSPLGAGALGTAIIEEAGQATPQSVAGLLWRSKRALVIGDPMQIQPVVSAPEVLIRHFCKTHEISNPLYSPLASSAQSLADESNELGTYLEQSAESAWVGSPLRVHRRCVEPMFSIANTIAYGGLMTYGTKDSPPDVSQLTYLPESTWYDVDGSCAARHWVPSHGDVACEILDRVMREYKDQEPDIFFITPFRSIKERLAKLLVDRARSIGCSKDVAAAIRRRVGTVHTFQGKEAEVVAFVLGCDENTRGAARWAGERPNLVNVAVTRAKKRIYVVGSLSLWHNQGFFSELASSLARETRRGHSLV